MCGYLLKSGGRVSYPVERSESLLSTTFSIDIRKDDPDIHPPSYCHKCRNVMQRTKGANTVTPFDWSEHISEEEDSVCACGVCLHIMDLEKGGGRKKDKKEKEKTGRPPKGSNRAVHSLNCTTNNTERQ